MSSNSFEYVAPPMTLEASLQQYITQQAIPGNVALDMQSAVPLLRELLVKYSRHTDNEAPYNRQIHAALKALENETESRWRQQELVRMVRHIDANLPQGGIRRLPTGDLLLRTVEAALKKMRMLSKGSSLNDLLATIDLNTLEGLLGVIYYDTLKQLIAKDPIVTKLWFNHEIRLKNLEALAIFLADKPNVTDIEIEFATLSDEEVQALTQNKHVRTLTLTYCNLGATAAQMLATYQLDRLHVRSNAIGDTVAEALAANRYLRMLGVYECEITPVGVRALLRSRSLQYLTLGDNEIDEATAAVLQTNTRLVWFAPGSYSSEAVKQICDATIARNRAMYGDAAVIGATIKARSVNTSTLVADSIMEQLYSDNLQKLRRAKKGVRFFENTVLPRLIRQNKWAIAKPVHVVSDVMEQPLTLFEATHPVTVAQAYGLLCMYVEEATKAIKKGYELAPGLQYSTEMQTALNKFAKQHNPALSEQARLMQLVRLMEASLHCKLQQLKKSGPVWRIAQAILCQQLTGVLGAATVQRIVQCDPTLTTLALPDGQLSDDDSEALLRLLARNRVIKTITHSGNAIDVAEFVASCNEQRTQEAAPSTEVTLKLG